MIGRARGGGSSAIARSENPHAVRVLMQVKQDRATPSDQLRHGAKGQESFWSTSTSPRRYGCLLPYYFKADLERSIGVFHLPHHVTFVFAGDEALSATALEAEYSRIPARVTDIAFTCKDHHLKA